MTFHVNRVSGRRLMKCHVLFSLANNNINFKLLSRKNKKKQHRLSALILIMRIMIHMKCQVLVSLKRINFRLPLATNSLSALRVQ